MADVPAREVLRQPAAELEQPIARVVGVGLAGAEVRFVAVDLERDLELWIREVDAEPPRRDNDLVLPYRLGHPRTPQQLQHFCLEVALSRRHPAANLEDRPQGLHAAPTLPADVVDVGPQCAQTREPADERSFDAHFEPVLRHH